ncbi:MAG: aspartyl/asparaginyl beta-hydroxylase domain-containing protein [Prosthecobacter sp.]|uniref:aspartyl/asparaginyl beta-hydroxylase domain-containing protein n=1 Tax=Prosthecobacter sp. TaxID=1965333 RepID=UPI0039007F68
MDAYHRRHRTFPAKGLWEYLTNRLQDAIEAVIAHGSIHADTPVYESKHFPWVTQIEADWTKVRAELDAVMQYRDAMPSFQDIVKEVGMIQGDDQWKTFFLKGVGMDCKENARHCPETMKVLDAIPGCTTGFFSILSPHKHIPQHRGPWAGVLRLHLGLQVPAPRHMCRIRIANEVYAWQEGEVVIFDDTYNHEVWNDTDGYRVVLFVDFARPLRWPLNRLNEWVMNLAALAPFLREAKGRQQASEKKFWALFGK